MPRMLVDVIHLKREILFGYLRISIILIAKVEVEMARIRQRGNEPASCT